MNKEAIKSKVNNEESLTAIYHWGISKQFISIAVSSTVIYYNTIVYAPLNGTLKGLR